jgi:hypothetical protein
MNARERRMSMHARRIVILSLIVTIVGVPVWAGGPRDVAKLGLAAGLVGLLVTTAMQQKGPEALRVVGRGVASSPALGDESTAAPGEPVFAVFRYEDVVAGRFQDGSRAFQTVDPTKFCTADSSACWVDKDSDGRFERNVGTGARIDLPYEQESLRVTAARDGFRYELLYQGAGGGVLRLLYREFVGDLARPAFSQELVYDLTSHGETLVAFKELRIRVASADNVAIRYSVSSDSPSWTRVADEGAAPAAAGGQSEPR